MWLTNTCQLCLGDSVMSSGFPSAFLYLLTGFSNERKNSDSRITEMVVQTPLSSRDCSLRRDWCVLLPQCNAENVKLWNPTVALGFLWTMSGKFLWSLNCLTRLNLCNVFSSQSQNLCVFNWCYGFSKHCSVSHHRLPFCHRPNCSYVSSSSHLSPYRPISFSVCLQREVSARWSLSGQKPFVFLLKQDARPECSCGHKDFFLIQKRFP